MKRLRLRYPASCQACGQDLVPSTVAWWDRASKQATCPVVAPTGVWVVDAKRYTSGRLERRDVGGWFKTDVRLFVGRRDVTGLLDGVVRQVGAVVSALADGPFGDVPVRGALCFVDTELRLFAKPFELRGVLVTWRKHLLAPMTAPGRACLDTDARRALEAHLAQSFPPAGRA